MPSIRVFVHENSTIRMWEDDMKELKKELHDAVEETKYFPPNSTEVLVFTFTEGYNEFEFYVEPVIIAGRNGVPFDQVEDVAESVCIALTRVIESTRNLPKKKYGVEAMINWGGKFVAVEKR